MSEKSIATRRQFLKTLGLCTVGYAVHPVFLGCKSTSVKPNIIIIHVDDLGWTDLGCFGSDLYKTPNIDRLAQQGIKFTNAYAACTVCSPTRASLLTGKYPARLHVTDWIEGHKFPYAKLSVPDWTMKLSLEEVTIAEALKHAGYTTAHIGKWHLGERENSPLEHGFDVNIGGFEKGHPPSYFSPYKNPNLDDGPKGEYLTDREAQEACRFIEERKDSSFFLHLAHYAVHTPLEGKAELVEKYKTEVTPEKRHKNPIYAAMVESVDKSMGKILALLDRLEITNQTTIIFTGDNGGLSRRNKNNIMVTDNSPLREGKGTAYEGGVRVPLIIKGAEIENPGSTCEEPVISTDYYPTILQTTGVRGDSVHNANIDGLSLIPLLKKSDKGLKRDAIYWHYPHYHTSGATPYGAVRAGDWKLIEFYEDMHVELYNLKNDIGEQIDLANDNQTKAYELRKKLHDWRYAVGAQMPFPNPDYDSTRARVSMW